MQEIKFKRIFKPSIALPLILLVAILFRTYTFFRYKYLFGYDPYVHLAVIREMLRENIHNNIYPLSLAPFGAKIDEPLGMYYVPLVIFKAISYSGVSLYNVFRITPVIFGVLTIIFFYLAMLNFYGKKEAFFSALFLSVMFGHISRSMANYYRGDNYVLFLFSMLLFVISIYLKKQDNVNKKRSTLLALTFGVILGVSSALWAGYFILFIFAIGMSGFIIILIIIEDNQEKINWYLKILIFLIFSISVGAIFVLSPIGRGLNPKYTSNFLEYFLYLFCPTVLFFGIMYFLRFFLRLNKIDCMLLFILSFIVTGAFILFYWREQFSRILTGFGYFNTSGFYETIMELQRPKFSDLWRGFNILFFTFPSYILKIKKDKVNIIHLGWILPSLYLLSNAVRFIFIASLAIAFMSGAGIVELFDKNISINRKVLGILVSLILIGSMYGSITAIKELKPVMNENWENALIYLKNVSKDNDIVLAWWDYGGFIQYYSERPTITDSVYGQGAASYVAKYYLGLVSEGELKEKGTRYVVVNEELIFKFGTIVKTAEIDNDYLMTLIPLSTSIGKTLIFSKGEISLVIRNENHSIDIRLNIAGKVIPVSKLIIEGNTLTEIPMGDKGVFVYVNLKYGYSVIMNEKAFNTKFAQLMFRNKGELVYSDGGIIKIFRI